MEDIKMSNRKALYAKLKPELDTAFLAAMSSMEQVDGALVSTLARQLEAVLQVPDAYPCAHGTEAMHLALAALDLPAGAEVIVPAFGGSVAAAALAQIGVRAVFADVNSKTFTIDPAAAAAVVTEKTVAILAIHLFGQCAAMAELLQVAATHKLLLIEDVTQSLGARYSFANGTSSYAGAMGAIAYTSFFPAKPEDLTDDGGAVFTTRPEIALRLAELQEQPNTINLPPAITGADWHLSSLQAAMVDVKLRYLPELLEARQLVAAVYNRLLQNIPNCQLPMVNLPGSHAFQHYSISVPPSLRDGLQAHLQQHFIPSMVYYPEPRHQSSASGEAVAAMPYNCPISERLHRSVLSLPFHTELSEEQQTYIAHHIRAFLQAN